MRILKFCFLLLVFYFAPAAMAQCQGLFEGEGPNDFADTFCLTVPQGTAVAAVFFSYSANMIPGQQGEIGGSIQFEPYYQVNGGPNQYLSCNNCTLNFPTSGGNSGGGIDLYLPAGTSGNVTFGVNGILTGGDYFTWSVAITPYIDSPTGLTAVEGNGQATLTWNPVAGATSYILLGGPEGTFNQVYAGSATTFVDSGLTNGNEYNFEVEAVGNDATSAPSASVSVTLGPQTPTSWLLYTTSESAPNTYPVTELENGTPINCAFASPSSPDNPNSTDPTDAEQGDCYNPLGFAFNLDIPLTYRASGNYCGDTDNWHASATRLPGDGYSDVSMLSNSVGSFGNYPPAASITSIEVSCQQTNGYTILITDFDGSVFRFTAHDGADPMSGSFTSSGGTSQGDYGTFEVYNQIPQLNGSFAGTLDTNLGYDGVTNLNTESNLQVNFGNQSFGPTAQFMVPVTTTVQNSPGTVCWLENSASFSSADPTASAYIPSFQSGDFGAIAVGNGDGVTVVNLFFNPGTDGNGTFGQGSDPDSLSAEFVSYSVMASPVSGCAGTTGYDIPFHQVINRPIATPRAHRPMQHHLPIAEWRRQHQRDAITYKPVLPKYLEPVIRPIVRDLPLEER